LHLAGFSFVSVRIWFDPDCSPRAFSLLVRASSQRTCPCLSTWAPLLGFPAVRRIRSEGVHIPPQLPHSGLRAAFRVSHPLHGLLLPRPCGFVSPRKRPSASPFRVFPSLVEATDSSPVTSHRAVTRPPTCVGRRSRLRGFVLLESPCRRVGGYPGPSVDPLLGFPSPRHSIMAMWQLITATPPVCFFDCRPDRLPGRRCGRQHFGVSLASVVPAPLSRCRSPPEVSGHRTLSMRQLCGSGLCIHRDFR